MKSSEKEIKLLLFLVAFLFIYAFYSFLLKPKMESVDALKNSVEQEDMLVRQMYNNTLNYSTNIDKINSLNDYILENSVYFYTSEEQEDLINQIDEWITESELKYDGITFDLPHYYNLAYLNPEDETEIEKPQIENSNEENSEDVKEVPYEIILKPAEKGEDIETPVLWSPVSISANGKYSNVMEFLDKLDKFKKDTVAYEMNIDISPESITEGEADPDVNFSINFYFMNLTGENLKNIKNGSGGLYQIPEMPADFVMPKDFVSGNYKNMFSLDRLGYSFKEMLPKF